MLRRLLILILSVLLLAAYTLPVFAREQADGSVKLSLRAVAPCKVSGVAQHFGGGGHAQAAGASVQLPIDEAIRQVVARMAEELESNA